MFPRRHPLPSCRIAGALLSAALPACVAYDPAPFDPLEALRALEGIQLEEEAATGRATTPTSQDPGASDGLSASEAVAVALRLNPSLRVVRAEVGIAESLLVEAGLLPDVEIGWEAGDALADLAGPDGVEGESYLSGVSVAWEVPRPGEVPARRGIARAGVESARLAVLAAEWTVARRVFEAHLALLGVRARLGLNEALLTIVERTFDYFERARLARAATALQANLARVALERARLDRVRLLRDEIEAEQSLNALLGLPPGTPLELEADGDAFPPTAPDEVADPRLLAEEAVRVRPDLRELLAAYRQAEESVRLEVARQWPRLFVGTGLTIALPLFRAWNRPAIRTALARRDAARRGLEAAIHELRREVHEGLAARDRARAEVAFLRDELLPRLDEMQRFTNEAFEAREVTLVEILAAQGQVLETQERFLEARIRYAQARVALESVTGRLLGAPEARPDPREETGKEVPRGDRDAGSGAEDEERR